MVSKEPIFSLDWAPDALIVTGLGGSVVHVNPRAEDLFGYRADELKDKPLELLIPEGLAGDAVESSPLQHASRPVVCAHRDGTRFPALVRWRPAPTGQGFIVFSVRDTERGKNARVAYLTHESQEVHGAHGARTGSDGGRIELVSLFAHDVRQSLQAVQLLCDTVRPSAPKAADAITEIVESVCRLLERCTRYADARTIEPLVEPCRLGELLGALGRELLPLAERKGLRLRVDRVDDVITTDPVLFREMLHNLLANAIRYTDAGRVDVRCHAGPGCVRVEIVDTGIGIPRDRIAAMMASAFDREDVEAADPSLDDTLARDLRAASLLASDATALAADDGAQRNRDGESGHGERAHGSVEGRGLGLAIVHQLAQLLNCALEVDSTLGRGSRFTVIAPRELDRRQRLERGR